MSHIFHALFLVNISKSFTLCRFSIPSQSALNRAVFPIIYSFYSSITVPHIILVLPTTAHPNTLPVFAENGESPHVPTHPGIASHCRTRCILFHLSETTQPSQGNRIQSSTTVRNRPHSNCWGIHIKTQQYICYTCVRVLGPTHLISLVGGSVPGSHPRVQVS